MHVVFQFPANILLPGCFSGNRDKQGWVFFISAKHTYKKLKRFFIVLYLLSKKINY